MPEQGRSLSPGDDASASGCDQDAAWLHDLFVRPERDLASLPDWARPVVTPPRKQDRCAHGAPVWACDELPPS